MSYKKRKEYQKMKQELSENRNLKEKNIYDLKNLLFYAVVTNNSKLEKQVKKEIRQRLTI